MINRQTILNKILNKESFSGMIGTMLAAFLIINLDTLVEIGTLTSFSSQSLPKALLWIILACSLILIIQGLIENKQSAISIDKDVIKKGLGFILYCGAFYLYLLLLPILGFMISTCMLSCVILINYRQKKIINYIMIFCIVIIIYFLFKYFMYISLPSGSLLGGN